MIALTDLLSGLALLLSLGAVAAAVWATRQRRRAEAAQRRTEELLAEIQQLTSRWTDGGDKR